MKRIAIEEAFVTQAIADEWDKVLANGAVGEPGFKKMGETILAPSPGTRIIHQRLTDLGENRIADMDADGDLDPVVTARHTVWLENASRLAEHAAHARSPDAQVATEDNASQLDALDRIIGPVARAAHDASNRQSFAGPDWLPGALGALRHCGFRP